MHRDFRHEAEAKGRPDDRKEWDHHGDREHQMEAREHARPHGRSLKTFSVRSDEAVLQIRELRARY